MAKEKKKLPEPKPGRGRYTAKKNTKDVHPATGCALVKGDVYTIEHAKAEKKSKEVEKK